MKHIVIGTLAHVDAGKTTLSESLLYTSGSIRTWGRVDHQDAFLDYDNQERKRGITIFSKQARFTWNDYQITLLDTPGHVDFSSEMERTLQVMDYAIVIVSGCDGVQSHTETIWELLKHYQIPAFIFVNKMDLSYLQEEEIMKDLHTKLSTNCVNFSDCEHVMENVAMCDDALLDVYMANGSIEKDILRESIAKRKVFPCFFGSALKQEGIDLFLNGLTTYLKPKQYPEAFAAKVFQITRNRDGNKLVHMKITGGSLKVKTKLSEEDKVDQIRFYSGTKYELVKEAQAGTICAVKGLSNVIVGEGLGEQEDTSLMLTSYLRYRLLLPEGSDCFQVMKQLKQLSEEDPQLQITYREQTQQIEVQLMGEIQIEIVKNLIQERFGLTVEFDQGTVNYKETIMETVEGVGHYEPLRHYAEVHLLMEPLPAGSGLQFYSDCSQEELDRNWQKLILTHLKEKNHVGVLTGSSITDMKITLLTGKAHQKHTEGGDFRQATYRAVRQGLKKAKCVVLEPYFKFRLELENEYMSKAIYDIERMNGTFEVTQLNDTICLIQGSAPVAKMQHYQSEVLAYTKGSGKLSCTLKDYQPCFNQEEVIEKMQYNSENDLENPCGSIFCSHGAGFYVPWNEVEKYMHVHSHFGKEIKRQQKSYNNKENYKEEDLETIFLNTYRSSKNKTLRKKTKEVPSSLMQQVKHKPLCMLVDGYNIIHSWEELKIIAKDNLDAARMRLIQILGDYQGYKRCLLIVVFDAYKVEDQIGSMYQDQNIYIVYTKTAQTADSYIEKATHDLAEQYQVVVATSDGLEQLIVAGQGAHRMSSSELKMEVDTLKKTRTQDFLQTQKQAYHQPMASIRTLLEEEGNKNGK